MDSATRFFQSKHEKRQPRTKKNCLSIGCVIAVLGICLAVATSASAVTVELNYDGSYDPTSTTPPDGQSTWSVAETGDLTLDWNYSPTEARILDDNSGAADGRIALYDTLDMLDPAVLGYTPDLAAAVWEYSIRASVPVDPPFMYPRTYLGVRDEGGPGGRIVMFAHSSTGDNLFYTVGAGTGVMQPELHHADPEAVPPIPGLNDGVMHDYRIVKHLGVIEEVPMMVVDFYLDSDLVDTRPYTDFTLSAESSNEGVGIWSSTPAECDYVIDTLYFTIDVSAELPPLVGDASGNGVVDSGDAAILAANWLQSDVEWGDGDFNGDNIVDDIDATMMAANWGATSALAAAVPEPSVLILLAAGLLALGFSRRSFCKRRTAGV